MKPATKICWFLVRHERQMQLTTNSIVYRSKQFHLFLMKLPENAAFDLQQVQVLTKVTDNSHAMKILYLFGVSRSPWMCWNSIWLTRLLLLAPSLWWYIIPGHNKCSNIIHMLMVWLGTVAPQTVTVFSVRRHYYVLPDRIFMKSSE